MEERWVFKNRCANSNSAEVWHLISASSKEYGLWKRTRIIQGEQLFFFFLKSIKPRAGKSATRNLYLTNMQLSLSIKCSATLGFAY